MDYHLEKEITLLDHTKHDGYHPWCLREASVKPIDEDEPFVTDYVPWRYGFYFTVSEMKLNHQFGLSHEGSYFYPDNDEFQVREKAPKTKFEDKAFINATFHSGICNDGVYLEGATRFSMFGSDRIIDDFNLQIFCIDSNNYSGEERYHIEGGISHTWEGSTEVDSIMITLWLSKKRFDKLARLISERSLDVAKISISDIPGFYSEPSSVNITTNVVKVLTENKEQKVTTPKGSNITPPRLGDIGDFILTLTTRNKFNFKQDFSTLNVKNLFENPPEQNQKEAILTEFIASQMNENQIIASRINNLLQFICVCLVIILLSIWL